MSEEHGAVNSCRTLSLQAVAKGLKLDSTRATFGAAPAGLR